MRDIQGIELSDYEKKDVELLLEKFAEYIDSNQFSDMYESDLFMKSDIPITTAITLILYEAKIDPLEHMDYIPEYFLALSDIPLFNVPKHILHIAPAAFENSKLKEIYLPAKLQAIGDQAFEGCSQLKRIIFDGTRKQFEKIALGKRWDAETAYTVIECTDGYLDRK